MSSDKPTPRIQVVSGTKTQRRRSWSDAEKRKIVQESLEDGIVQAQLARRHGISPSQLYDWRYRFKAGLLGGEAKFSQVIVLGDDPDAAKDPASSAPVQPDLVVEVGRRYRLAIPTGFDMDAAAQLLRGLK